MTIRDDEDRDHVEQSEVRRAREVPCRPLFESGAIGIIHCHVDGRITGANDTFLQMVGYTHDDVAEGRLNWRAMTPEEHREGNDHRIDELLTTGLLRLSEKAYLHRDGSVVPVVIGGTMLEGSRTELITFVLDISERKRREARRESLLRRLERSEERYRLAAFATEDAIYDVDVPTGRMSLQSMHGRADVSSTDGWMDLIHPDDRGEVLAGLEALRERGSEHWEAEYRLRGPDGVFKVVVDRGSVAFDDDGRPVRMVGGIRDVTARRRREELERQLIGIVSHDLRNPLGTIVFAAEMLTRSQSLDERGQRNATRIKRAAERATRMVRDLLDFTKARDGAGIPVERRSVALGSVFQGVVEDIGVLHPERAIVFQSSGACRGAFDPDRLTQVLTNLLENAVKYSPARSVVHVTLRGEADDVTLVVHNEGPPIPADVLPRIFEPLRRGETSFDEAGRSVGLGLFIVKNLVEGHGGSIDVASSEGEGTRFTVRLPRSSVPRAA
ncbi:MAG: PAS domain S-box protein [Labilithrix sp.]|nr:PAS domain S-box protein [Labilithrix sp.]MCW5832780.1 PAS domain S-box protein [Labilithrix sp.]